MNALFNLDYLQVSDFSSPFASILHESAVYDKGKYFATHEFVSKNLVEKCHIIISLLWWQCLFLHSESLQVIGIKLFRIQTRCYDIPKSESCIGVHEKQPKPDWE